MNDKHVTDIVTLFTIIAAALFSNEVAAVVGPYVVIIIAASVGASFRLSMRETMKRLSAVWFFFRQVGLAVIFTGVVAAIVNAYRPDLAPRVTIAPIALVIGYLHWPAVMEKLARWAMGSIDLLRGGKGGSP